MILPVIGSGSSSGGGGEGSDWIVLAPANATETADPEVDLTSVTYTDEVWTVTFNDGGVGTDRRQPEEMMAWFFDDLTEAQMATGLDWQITDDASPVGGVSTLVGVAGLNSSDEIVCLATGGYALRNANDGARLEGIVGTPNGTLGMEGFGDTVFTADRAGGGEYHGQIGPFGGGAGPASATSISTRETKSGGIFHCNGAFATYSITGVSATGVTKWRLCVLVGAYNVTNTSRTAVFRVRVRPADLDLTRYS